MSAPLGAREARPPGGAGPTGGGAGAPGGAQARPGAAAAAVAATRAPEEGPARGAENATCGGGGSQPPGSSSSGTEGSSSSGGTQSTQDTLPSQDLPSLGEGEGDAAGPKPWGRLYSTHRAFPTLDLVCEEYLFGRAPSCSVCFNDPHIRACLGDLYSAYSSKHFRIYRGQEVFLEDYSSNGTYINGEKVGKNKRHVLTNNAEISIALATHRAFVFSNLERYEESHWPEEIKKKYIITHTLGSGVFGEVKLAFHKGSEKKVAIKVVPKRGLPIPQSSCRDVKTEADILKKLKHPCIITLEDAIDSADALYLVLELMEGGELYNRVKKGALPEHNAKLIFYQLVLAVQYLHGQGVTHRDLKPENVLLSSNSAECLVKVSDFGLSRFVGEQYLMRSLCGTPAYQAPEVLASCGLGGYTRAVDYWSLGVLLFICLSGYPPFSEEFGEMSVHDQICTGTFDFPEDLWKNVSEEAEDLVRKLMVVEVKRRYTTEQALGHGWLQDQEMIHKAQSLMAAGSGAMPPPLVANFLPGAGRKRPAEEGAGGGGKLCLEMPPMKR
ncbi:serine/threonine-protein kinase Chk2-like [Lethenteron reissneri]|uniref:serine/threonine-protein kinase Chk2-like n=1 Tax=Lethenteron reissneri TaxID=7753 RepID=UPI002AB6DA47|nr:serine/threonine-protein kinase Chk2-like [Lethenteron reissneri]